MNERNPENYSEELLEAARRFDGEENAFSENLKQEFNRWINSLDEYKNIPLKFGKRGYHPDAVVWVDASDDKLPATRESRDVSGIGEVVNTNSRMRSLLQKNPSSTLILSHCVSRSCYNSKEAEKIENSGSVASPGKWTAPGGIFSDKLKTYRMLDANGKGKLIANYKFIDPKTRSPRQVAGSILDEAASDIKTERFFVKPTRGGGGLGGFRLSTRKKGSKTEYFLPDLSRLSGVNDNLLAEPLIVDTSSEAAIEELWWIYNKFRSSEILKKNYIDVDLSSPGQLKKLLDKSLSPVWISRSQAEERLTCAIKLFEKKFGVRYSPLLNHYINFGTWGLRAHYRLGRDGIIAEAVYSRLFQIKFTSGGIGYAGADNISNKQTGELELDRLQPVNSIMVNAVGGRESFLNLLKKGAEAFKIFTGTFPSGMKDKIPARVQFDIAPVDGYICEGNADTARGFCLAQNFNSFTSNIKSWFEDSLDYYSFRKGLE